MRRTTRGHRAALAAVVLIPTLVLGLAGLGAGPATAVPHPTAATVVGAVAIPAPGSVSAKPSTDITLRNLRVGTAATLTVVGSVSGDHSGTVRSHPDGRGLTWRPTVGFRAGEVVTVTSSVAVRLPADAKTPRTSGTAAATTTADAWSFTVGTPAVHPGITSDGSVVGTPGAVAGKASTPGLGRAQVLAAAPVTRPDLRAPSVTIGQAAAGTAPGLLFATPQGAANSDAGVMVYDETGRLVYFRPVTDLIAGNADVQTYQGRQVLTWFEGTAPFGAGSYRGEWIAVDSTYTEVARIRMGNGYQADIHDLQITPQGTALMLAYNPLRCDNVTITGCTTGATVLDGVIQEVDIATGLVLFEWHGLDHFSLGDSYLATTSPQLVDYMHMNSLDLDTDGNILFSARHTSALTKVDRTTGDIVWILGGKRNQFDDVGDPSAPDLRGPDFPHDFRPRGSNSYSYFDNGVRRNAADATSTSRAAFLTLDLVASTATYTTFLRHQPASVFGPTQGKVQPLPSGHNLVAWGGLGLVDEFDATGAQIFSAQLVQTGTYRQVRHPWQGAPTTQPTLGVAARSAGGVTAAASWNGDTRTTAWQLMTGATPTSLTPSTTISTTGFETTLTVPPGSRYVAVRALDSAGVPLPNGQSPTIAGTTTFAESNALSVGGTYRPLVGDFGGSRNDDVFYYAPGPGGEFLHVSDGAGGFTSLVMPSVGGDYQPLVGDFVGDDRDEVLWQSPTSASGFMWRFDRGARTAAPLIQSSPVATRSGTTASFVLDHRPSFGGSKDEVFYYTAGAGFDGYTAYTWDGGQPLVVRSRQTPVNGTYRPVAGDFDGNGLADIMWYGPGAAPDALWLTTGGAAGSSGQRDVAVGVNGQYTVLAANVSGSAADELVFWAAGASSDFVWSVSAAGVVTSRNVTTAGSPDPIVLRGATDSLLLWSPGSSPSMWRLPATGPVIEPSGNTAVPVGYRALVGDFVGAGGSSSVLWYAPGPQPERLYSR